LQHDDWFVWIDWKTGSLEKFGEPLWHSWTNKMSFSAGLKLTGLDDFIAPSQACIKPVENLAGIATFGRHSDKYQGLWAKRQMWCGGYVQASVTCQVFLNLQVLALGLLSSCLRPAADVFMGAVCS
jgi:hypothetical protein